MGNLGKRLEALEKNEDPMRDESASEYLLPDEIDTMLLAMYERGSVEWDEVRSWREDAVQLGQLETVKMMDAWFDQFQAAGLGNA